MGTETKLHPLFNANDGSAQTLPIATTDVRTIDLQNIETFNVHAIRDALNGATTLNVFVDRSNLETPDLDDDADWVIDPSPIDLFAATEGFKEFDRSETPRHVRIRVAIVAGTGPEVRGNLAGKGTL